MENFGLDPILIRAQLIHGCGAQFEDTASRTLCHIKGMRLVIHDTADLFMANEVFRGLSYPIPFKEQCVVVDVGMNVAYAALEFAQNPYVKRVYSFEPFPRTYQMAMENIDLNPELKKKIEAKCVGLAIRDDVRTIEYSETIRGGMTTKGIPQVGFSPGVVSMAQIELKEVCGAIAPILERHTEGRLILKMDCEGEEFDLIPALDNARLLEKFDMVMIEFHYHKPDLLLSILESRGYHSVGATRADQIFFQGKEGNMIYAAKDPAFLE